MKPTTLIPYTAKCIMLALLIATGVGCTQTAAVGETVASTEEPGVEVPPEVLVVHESILDFLRDGANECVPPEGASFRVSTGDDMPEGFGIYHFTSGGCVMTVSYLLPATEDTVYHVALGDSDSGLCWQATATARGKILTTGSAAEPRPDEPNPAALYCEAQGYRFEIREQKDGSQCGMCVFSDESACVSWAFLRGQCQPGDRPAAED